MKPARPSLVTRISRRLVAAALLRGDRLSSANLARETGLPENVLRQAIDEMEAMGLVEGGPDTAVYAMRGAGAFCVGIDLGGTKVTAAIADFSGAILAEATEPTDPRGGEQVLSQLQAIAGRLATVQGIETDRIGGVTVGMPGVIHPRTGAVSLGPNIPGLSSLDVPAVLAGLFGQAVEVENDVNLAMLGEAWQGHARGCRNAALLSLGTGTGLGLLVNGRLARGTGGAAGEISYLPVGADLTSTAALDVGSFELEIGSAGILRRYAALGGTQAATVRDIFALLEQEDAIAMRVADHVAHIAALAIVSLQATLDLDKIILGGSIGVRPELVARVRQAVATLFARHVDIAASALGSRAGLVGAVASASRRLQGQLAGLTAEDDDILSEFDLAGAAE